MKDPEFFKRYFYKVSLIRQEFYKGLNFSQLTAAAVHRLMRFISHGIRHSASTASEVKYFGNSKFAISCCSIEIAQILLHFCDYAHRLPEVSRSR
jgi:hypothetical protein